MDNKFLEALLAYNPEYIEFKVDKKFEEETGIKGKRIQSLIKSEGKDATVAEVNSLLKYYNKRGVKLSFQDLFGGHDVSNDNEEQDEEQVFKKPTLKPKRGKETDLDDIMDNF